MLARAKRVSTARCSRATASLLDLPSLSWSLGEPDTAGSRTTTRKLGSSNWLCFCVPHLAALMIPLSKALATWQTVTGKVPEEADDIRICGGISADGGHTRAFINKLDAKVGTLSNCERLSLSTNCIDKLLPFSGMTKLKILSLGRNLLKRVEKLDDLAGTLEQLWLSYNSISGLDGVLPLTNLQVLYMAHNAIKDWAEIEKLAGLAHLREVIFIGNPIYEGMDDDTARAHVVKRIPHIVKVDTKLVTDELREAAAALP